jgi:MoxR-like ATPase
MSEHPQTSSSDLVLLSKERVESARAQVATVTANLQKVLFGVDELLEFSMVGMLAGAHILLEGLPGLGKTQLVRSLSQLLQLQSRRVQFTPDLLTSDITGTHILNADESGARRFEFHPGPIFANFILADEINRASPKTQSALLEAMQEGNITVLGETRPLPKPFFVLATQNPIELEGTYPLPEAQLDRFGLKLLVPPANQETLSRIITTRRGQAEPQLEPVLDQAQLLQLLEATRQVAIATAVADYIAALIAATQPTPEGVGRLLRYGASPRAALSFAQNARAKALMSGRAHVGFQDVLAVAIPTMRHRIGLTHSARLEGYTTDSVIREIINAIPSHGREIPDSLAVNV